jgi:ribulose-phosphate 3-epimerase
LSPSPASTVALLKSLSPTISVGMITADLMALGSELELLARTGVRLVHVDVMDGCFTPMMTVGPPLIRAMKTPLLKDVHLMIRDPLEKLGDFVAAGADIVTVHAESCTHIHRVLQQLGAMTNANDPARGLVRGIALNPGTPLEVIEPLLGEVELVLVLAVNPGFSGQSFIGAAMDRLAKARRMIAAAGREILLGVDGGITRGNIATFAGAGVDIVVTGSAVFDGKAPADNARYMLDALRAR